MNAKYTDLENTFPAEVDNIDKMSDLTIRTKPIADHYYSLMAANKVTDANTYLEQNLELLKSMFNADKYNKMRDAMVSLERYVLELEARVATLEKK